MLKPRIIIQRTGDEKKPAAPIERTGVRAAPTTRPGAA